MRGESNNPHSFTKRAVVPVWLLSASELAECVGLFVLTECRWSQVSRINQV